MAAVTCAWTLTGATEGGVPVEVNLRGRASPPRLWDVAVEGEVVAPFVDEPHCQGQVRLGGVARYELAGRGWTVALRQRLTLVGGPPGFTCVDGTVGGELVHLRFDPRGGVWAWWKSLALCR